MAQWSCTRQRSDCAPTAVQTNNGPILRAGANYWIRIVPSTQSRLIWFLHPHAVTGEELYEDPYTPQFYSIDGGGSQGTFDVRVRQ